MVIRKKIILNSCLLAFPFFTTSSMIEADMSDAKLFISEAPVPIAG